MKIRGRSHSTYYLPKVEIKDGNVMINGKKFCKCNFVESNFIENKVYFNFYQYKNDTIQQFKRKAIKFTT